MSRAAILLSVLAAIAVAALFYFFAWQPKQDEIAEIEAQVETVQLEQQRLQAEIAQLEQVRAEAPEVEAAIVAAESIVPRSLSLPSALRQLQLAADEAGARLVTVAPTRAAQVEDARPGLAAIRFTVEVQGGYYQIVDFLRRVEDPVISPRGILWDSLTVAPLEYPTLSATASGTMFALLPVEEAPAPPPPPTGEDEAVETEAGA